MDLPPSYEDALIAIEKGTVQPILTSEESAQIKLMYGAELTRDQCPLSLPPSKAKFKERAGGIESFDRSLQKDSDAVWSFFMTHMTKPRVKVYIEGYYVE